MLSRLSYINLLTVESQHYKRAGSFQGRIRKFRTGWKSPFFLLNLAKATKCYKWIPE